MWNFSSHFSQELQKTATYFWYLSSASGPIPLNWFHTCTTPTSCLLNECIFEHLWSTVRLYVTISSGTTLYWLQPLDVLWVASARGPALLLSISHLYNWYRKATDKFWSGKLTWAAKKKHSTSTYMNSVEYYM